MKPRFDPRRETSSGSFSMIHPHYFLRGLNDRERFDGISRSSRNLVVIRSILSLRSGVGRQAARKQRSPPSEEHRDALCPPSGGRSVSAAAVVWSVFDRVAPY